MSSSKRGVPNTRTPLPIQSQDKSAKLTKRTDRSANQFRKVFLKPGIVTQASGSSYIELNKTKVICAVYGPRHSSKAEFSDEAKLTCDFKFASFSSADQRKKSQGQEKEEKEYANLIVQSLEFSVLLKKYPKSVIDLYIIVLESDGGALSAAITCASMALADAGVEMYDLVACCSVAKTSTYELLLDPDGIEEKSQQGGALVALMPSLNESTQLFQSGELTYTEALEAIQICLDGCSKLYAIMKKNLMEVSATRAKRTLIPMEE